jgi:hypothetical protein
MKQFLLIISLLISTNLIFCQNANQQKIKISIIQECLPGPNPVYTYKVSDKSLTILRSRKILGQKIKLTGRIYSLGFNRIQKDSLRLILSEIDLSKYKNSYTSSMLDGVVWEFDIISIFGSKKISLWNYYTPDFGKILDFLNRQIPANKRYISFDILGIRSYFKDK